MTEPKTLSGNQAEDMAIIQRSATDVAVTLSSLAALYDIPGLGTIAEDAWDVANELRVILVTPDAEAPDVPFTSESC